MLAEGEQCTVIATGPWTAEAQDLLHEQWEHGRSYGRLVNGRLWHIAFVGYELLDDGAGGHTFMAEFTCWSPPLPFMD
jgi:hypothetical protein